MTRKNTFFADISPKLHGQAEKSVVIHGEVLRETETSRACVGI